MMLFRPPLHHLVCLGSLVVFGVCAQSRSTADDSVAIAQGHQFLSSLFDRELDLLPEYSGHHVYWLYHDNYLAAKVLSKSDPELAQRIVAAIKRHGARDSGKIEILFDEAAQPLPFRHYSLVDVTRIGAKLIRTEKTTKQPMRGWQNYADLRFLAAIAAAKADPSRAQQNFTAGMEMFDGVGFDDPAKQKLKIYATYKLALAMIAASRLRQNVPPELVTKLKAMQDKSGGWITDYHHDGRPVGKANVETTCLAILALQKLPSTN